MRTPSKGFTLIELAVVIAIIAILAAVAIPRFGNVSASAERATIKNMVSNLTSAAAIYTTEQGSTPIGFSNYVVGTGTATGANTLSLQTFGRGSCSVGTTITGCAFNHYNNVVYSWNNGQITVAGTPTTGGPAI